LAFSSFFDGVGTKKCCLAVFENLWLSDRCRLEILGIFLRPQFLFHLPQSHPPRYKRLCRLCDVTGQGT